MFFLKRYSCYSLALLVTSLVLTNTSGATTITGPVSLNYGDNRVNNGGGEFNLTDQNNITFTTFCLETQEHFWPTDNKIYTVDSIGDYAQLGGNDLKNDTNDPKDPDKDYLSNATKWLMNSYINQYDSLFGDYDNDADGNSIFSYSDATNANQFAGLVQQAIWYFEDEATVGVSEVKANVITKWIITNITAWDTYDSEYLTNVQVANLSYNGVNKQSQLFATAPVPEPATMLLFGTGLAGLASISRRRKK